LHKLHVRLSALEAGRCFLRTLTPHLAGICALTGALSRIEFAPLGPEIGLISPVSVANITLIGVVGRYLDESPTGVEVKIEPN
jgi:hypothetical protein